MKVKAIHFLKYAGYNQERWNLLVGRQIMHESFKQGIISKVSIEDKEISIWIDFDEPTSGTRSRCFGPQGMYAIADIEFPDALAHKIIVQSGAGKQIHIPPSSFRRPSKPAVLETTTNYPPKGFLLNQEISLKNEPARRGRIIRELMGSSGEWNYEVYFSADEKPIVRESDIEIYDPIPIWGTLDDLLRDLALVKLRKPMGDTLYALYASRTKFEVYQFKPAIKFLANPDQRMLIADEVGLGKTIEAGIIYLELQARLNLDRVLIVCPSSLRQKWQDEMKSRFDEEFNILDYQDVHRFLDQYRQFGGSVRLRAITSLELIRRRDLAEALADVRLDLLIIDEAHHCRNTATLANAVASVLAENSDAALLLTATPLQMGKSDLFNLLGILSPGEFDNLQAFTDRLEPNQFINRAAQILATGNPKEALQELRKIENTGEKNRFLGNPYYKQVLRILGIDYPSQQELITAQRRLIELNTLSSVFTRTRKRDIQEKSPKRTAYTLSVHFTPEEKNFYEQVVEEVRQEYNRSHLSGSGSGWITIMKERQVASCISAVLHRQAENHPEFYAEDEAFGSDFYKDNATDESLSDYQEQDGLQPGTQRKIDVRPRVRPGRKILKDSKFDVFWTALQKVLADDPKAKILIFSFFRDTINYLQRELEKRHVEVRAIHGGYKVSDRNMIIEQFRDTPQIRVLISSDVGSEGLDFQFCDTIFNYDLPWNPMKVEQRIGRIDRFGQESDAIRIYNLVIEDTVESRILMRLYERIEIFKQSIGDLEAILGDQIRELTQAVFSNRLSPQEEIKRAEEAVIKILRQKQEIEEFEQKKLQFLGQEAIFATTVERTIESGLFVSEAELRSLVEGYLREKFPLSRLVRNDPREATYTLFANNDLVEELKDFILRPHNKDRTAQQFLLKLRPGSEIPMTFSSELAFQRKLLEFITSRHPLAQAAVEHWKKRTTGIKRLAHFQVRTDAAHPGNYYFFIFSVDSEGIDKDSRLMTVTVSVDTGDVHNLLSKKLLHLLQTDALPAGTGEGHCNEDELKSAEDAAMLFMTHERDTLYSEVSNSNDAIVNARLAAVEQSYNAKRTRINGILKKVNNESIKRMYDGQLRNMDAKYRAKVQGIEARRRVGISFSLQLRGCVDVI